MKCKNCGFYLDRYTTGLVACPHCGAFTHLKAKKPKKKTSRAAATAKSKKTAKAPARKVKALPKKPKKLAKRRRRAPLLGLAVLLFVAGCGVGTMALSGQSPPLAVAPTSTKPVTLKTAPTPRDSTPVTAPKSVAASVPASATSPNSSSTPSSSSAARKPSVSPVNNTPSDPNPPVVPPPQQCSKNTSYKPADALPISPASPGLKQQTDAPQYYTVYGYTGNQIRAQLNACTPLGGGTSSHYDGETTWYLNYAYNFQQSVVGGPCSLTSVTVGLHVAFVYPNWQATQYTAAGVSGDWQNFITNLTTHEQGHKNIASQHASQLYSGFQNFPPMDCSTIVQAANNYGDSEVSALNQAESDYDAQTNHGVNQGATFP